MSRKLKVGMRRQVGSSGKREHYVQKPEDKKNVTFRENTSNSVWLKHWREGVVGHTQLEKEAGTTCRQALAFRLYSESARVSQASTQRQVCFSEKNHSTKYHLPSLGWGRWEGIGSSRRYVSGQVYRYLGSFQTASQLQTIETGPILCQFPVEIKITVFRVVLFHLNVNIHAHTHIHTFFPSHWRYARSKYHHQCHD